MGRKYLYLAGIIILLVLGAVVLRGGLGENSGEDDWIKDSKGVWVKHGNPVDTPSFVVEQQSMINCARSLYFREESRGVDFNSQCLGRCMDYSVEL